MSHDEYSYSFLLWPKIMTATSTEQRTASSCAFLNSPPFRLRNVTERLRSSLMALISIFLRPMMKLRAHQLRTDSKIENKRYKKPRSDLRDTSRDYDLINQDVGSTRWRS